MSKRNMAGLVYDDVSGHVLQTAGTMEFTTASLASASEILRKCSVQRLFC